MQKVASALICSILGFVLICFPLLGVVPLEVLSGFTLLFLGLGLVTTGFTSFGDNVLKGVVEAGLGVFALILGLGFICNPVLFSFAASIFVFISGLLLILVGFEGLVTKTEDFSSSIVALVIGILYMIVAIFVANPYYLGVLIGFWMLITGGLLLIQGDN